MGRARRTGRITVLVAAVVGAAACGGEAVPRGAVVIENVHALPMVGSGTLERASVVVVDGRIEAIGPDLRLRTRGAARVIDGQGGYVLPGLIDPHVHVRKPEELGLYLASGITTVRNMNGNFGDPLTWRGEIEAGQRLGPRFITASPVLTDEIPDYRWGVEGPDHARRLVRQFAADGYDLIKVYHLREPTFFALVEEAAEVGIPVAGHYPVPTAEPARILATHMVSIEHLDELVAPAFGGASDYDGIPDLVEEIRASGVAIGTVLAQWEGVNRALDDPGFLRSDSLVATATRYFGDDGVEQLNRMAEDFASRDEASRGDLRSDFPFLFALLRALDEAGVPLLASTDAHQALAPAGEALHNELDLFVRADLAPYAALRAATVYPAMALGLADEVGTLEEGKSADLVLVSENPLDDPATLRRPVGVMVRGEWLDRQRLDSLFNSSLPGGG